LFGFSAKPARQVRDADLDPGLNKMLELFFMDKVQARPPPANELVQAFNTFFAHKMKIREAVNNIQAQHALRTFRHLRDTNVEEEGFGFSLQDLQIARDCLMKIPADRLDTHNEFARELYEEITRRKAGTGAGDETGGMGDLKQLIMVLTQTNGSIEARQLVEEFWKGDSGVQKTSNREKMGIKLWILVLKGFAKESNEAELLKTVQVAEAHGVPYSPTFHEIMTTFYAQRNDVANTKEWYTRKIHQSHKPNARTMSEVLWYSLRNDETEWCNSVFKALLETNPNKPTWDVIFQWAAGALGKGVEDVEHMIEVMIRLNGQNETVRPDNETINGLVELAISKNDAYLAERYIALGNKFDIRPNARTYILQMNYRIDHGDLSGAQAAYHSLQAEEVVDQEDLPVINKYIRALCSAKNPNYDRATAVAADLEERKIRPEADTVAALSLLHFNRGELPEVIDILQANVFHYTLDERAGVRDVFLAYCFDRSHNTEDVWDMYTILRQMFDEMDRETRTKIMSEFFDRKRSDMAGHVFGHMRQHVRPEKRPTTDTYVQCFEGIAKNADQESLSMIHNMMKMDANLEPTTKLYNALMLAYTACDDPYRALDFWADITNSVEGPSYRSLEIVFRVCELRPYGDKTAKDIWNKMRRMEIEVTPEVFSAYVGAIAGQGLYEEAKALIEGMEADVGYGPDKITYVV
jgi:hypothetical protein